MAKEFYFAGAFAPVRAYPTLADAYAAYLSKLDDMTFLHIINGKREVSVLRGIYEGVPYYAFVAHGNGTNCLLTEAVSIEDWWDEAWNSKVESYS